MVLSPLRGTAEVLSGARRVPKGQRDRCASQESEVYDFARKRARSMTSRGKRARSMTSFLRFEPSRRSAWGFLWSPRVPPREGTLWGQVVLLVGMACVILDTCCCLPGSHPDQRHQGPVTTNRRGKRPTPLQAPSRRGHPPCPAQRWDVWLAWGGWLVVH